MIITYDTKGRFGNNLFQYIALKIIQFKLYNKDRIYRYEYQNLKIKEDSFNITDGNFFEVLYNIDIIPLNKNVYLDGFFQFSKYILENKKYILSLINKDNHEQINDTYIVSYLSNKINSFKRVFDTSEVVLHLRLDDFLRDKVCMHYINYFNVILRLPSYIKKVIIIVDKCKEHWEKEYLFLIYEFCINHNLEVQIESGGDMIDDFCKMYHSKNFISSNSTFSYLCGLLGTHDLNWCFTNSRYPNQKIEKFDDKTTTIDTVYL